jgi:hypothetical protein
MKLFVSLFAYSFAKHHWPHADAAAAREIELGESSSVPGFRTFHRLRKLADHLELHRDDSTLIARARDRAAGAFLRSSCDQWIAIDDDVDADDAACHALLEKIPNGILAAAMRVRAVAPDGSHPFALVIDPHSEPVDAERLTSHPFLVRRTGMGLTRFPRDMIEHIAARYTEQEWDEPDPVRSGAPTRKTTVTITAPGIFLETVRNREWLSEDYAFSERAHACGVPIWTVVLPGVTHAGIPNVAKPTPPSRL